MLERVKQFCIFTMFLWFNDFNISASLNTISISFLFIHINISTYALPIMCVFIIFIATFYLVILWIPSTTLPNPPSPSSFTISYSENVELESNSSPTTITNNLKPLDAYNDAPALINSTSSSIISTPSWL